MYVLTISPVDFYPGSIVFSSKWKDNDGKISRSIRTDVAIDNTVVISDNGFSWGSSDMMTSLPFSNATFETLKDWLQAWPIVTIARIDGLFKAVLKSIKQSSNKILVEISITERIS